MVRKILSWMLDWLFSILFSVVCFFWYDIQRC
jgi:hypothetical protein